MEILNVIDLYVRYGQAEAVHGISFRVHPGQVVALLGPNGAGKTSTLNALMGAVPGAEGTAEFKGIDLLGTRSWRIARGGIGYVPEGRRVFPSLTVEENLAVATANGELIDEMCRRFPILGERRDQLAGTLSGGEQQQLALARALATEPDLLLLDELSMGVAPLIVDQLYVYLEQEKAGGRSMLIVEQSPRHAMALADYVYVLIQGRIVLAGTPSEIESNALFQQGYLGVT